MSGHLVLVPGFGGFDALGSLRYYHGVTDVLRDTPYAQPVHYFRNLPTASVQIRAQALQVLLSELRARRVIGPDDDIHLVGHSTGGLDLRQLLINLLKRADMDAGAQSLLEQVRTVQFLSTPHRGTALAHHLSSIRIKVLASQLLLRVAYESARVLRGAGLAAVGAATHRLGGVFRHQKTDDVIDAVIDTLRGCHFGREDGLREANARGNYFDLLRWLLHMTSDFAAITDLDPSPSREAPWSPAHATDEELESERHFLDTRRIRVRSIVTIVSPGPSRRPDLFHALHALTAFRPPQALQRTCKVQRLWSGGEEQVLEARDNDGIVNSVSQVWPDRARSHLLEGDHADVIGHFQSQPATPESSDETEVFRQYDLLKSPSGFTLGRFTQLWEDIAAFTVGLRMEDSLSTPP